MSEFFSILTYCWSSNPGKAFEICLSSMKQIGESLYTHKSAFYDVLRSHYSLYDLPLETDIFSYNNILSSSEGSNTRALI